MSAKEIAGLNRDVLEKSAKKFCFDIDKLLENINPSDSYKALIIAITYIEHVSGEALADEFKNSNALKMNNMGFSIKLNLLDALGLVDIELVRSIKYVAKLRNKAVHSLNFVISEREMSATINQIPKRLQKFSQEHDGDLLDKFKHALVAIIIALESVRQQSEIRRVEHIQSSAILRDTIDQIIARDPEILERNKS